MCLKKIVSADKDNILSLSQVENPSFPKKKKNKQNKTKEESTMRDDDFNYTNIVTS